LEMAEHNNNPYQPFASPSRDEETYENSPNVYKDRFNEQEEALAAPRGNILDAAQSDDPISNLVSTAAGPGAESFRVSMRQALRSRINADRSNVSGGGGAPAVPAPPSSDPADPPSNTGNPGNPNDNSITEVPAGRGRDTAGHDINNAWNYLPDNNQGGLNAGEALRNLSWDGLQDAFLLWSANNPEAAAGGIGSFIGMLTGIPFVGGLIGRTFFGDNVENSEAWNNFKAWAYDTIWSDEGFRPPLLNPETGEIEGYGDTIDWNADTDMDGVPDWMQAAYNVQWNLETRIGGANQSGSITGWSPDRGDFFQSMRDIAASVAARGQEWHDRMREKSMGFER
jgi:hypothetical protein